MAIHKDSAGRIFWGLVIVLFGVLLLLDQLDQLDFGRVISRYWPVLLILVGFWNLFANNFRNTGGPVLLIALGVIFELGKLDILGRNAWNFVWPILIIAVGLWIVLGALGRRASTPAPAVNDGTLDAFAIFSGLNRRIDAPDFRGGKASAIMGGIDLDLRGAGLAEGAATIDLSVVMGGITVRVPHHWRVELDARPLLGGIEDTHTYEPGTQAGGTLHVQASAVLGGIEIKD
jgi:predicted membrane protein